MTSKWSWCGNRESRSVGAANTRPKNGAIADIEPLKGSRYERKTARSRCNPSVPVALLLRAHLQARRTLRLSSYNCGHSLSKTSRSHIVWRKPHSLRFFLSFKFRSHPIALLLLLFLIFGV